MFTTSSDHFLLILKHYWESFPSLDFIFQQFLLLFFLLTIRSVCGTPDGITPGNQKDGVLGAARRRQPALKSVFIFCPSAATGTFIEEFRPHHLQHHRKLREGDSVLAHRSYKHSELKQGIPDTMFWKGAWQVLERVKPCWITSYYSVKWNNTCCNIIFYSVLHIRSPSYGIRLFGAIFLLTTA